MKGGQEDNFQFSPLFVSFPRSFGPVFGAIVLSWLSTVTPDSVNILALRIAHAMSLCRLLRAKIQRRELNSLAIEPEKDFGQNFACEPWKAQNQKMQLIFNKVIIVFHLAILAKFYL